ncbi:MAG: hypothetical protein B7X39_09345 [Lysobacterales bacterium 14-68-21]|nr:MAG: hypothetical protein B7X45_05165 [Xanthomonadales bacterium 15-68-25]OZB66924.1 MAG: hypothetical protein B7X39_09345 [Xanthomonadales bacterium 14-68-21]
MAVDNAAIAAAFEEIADLLELQQANPFRVRAYRNAARTLASWPEEMSLWAAQGRDFDELPGVGKDLAAKIAEILQRGTCDQLERLRASFPRGITHLLQIPGLGPRRVHALYHELGVRTPQELLDAARAGHIRAIPGFGATSERRIAEAVAGYLDRSHRWPVARVDAAVQAVLAHLRAGPGVEDVVVAGSYRRRRDTVGDIDVLVAGSRGGDACRRLCDFERVSRVLAQGRTRASVVLRDGLQVDLRVVRPESFGAALVYFTGSKPHNIALRRIAQSRGLKINEYGVYRGTRRIAGKTEASVYATIGLPWIPPELREDHGEIEAARSHALPRLIERGDLRGDLHAHTSASDGADSLEAMAAAAREAGLDYLAVTDHSRGLPVAHGLDEKRLLAQMEAIDRLNERLRGIVLLKGIEVEILADGSLDLPDRVLGRLDLVVGAVHSAFDLPREQQTARILRAMDHPHFSILAHPNGRLFGTRGGCALDMERIVRHAAGRGCFLELNAQPDRLDLFDVQCRQARDAGVAVAIGSDAHRGSDFHWLQLGVDQARRGWLQKDDVLNTLPLPALRRRLAASMGR